MPGPPASSVCSGLCGDGGVTQRRRYLFCKGQHFIRGEPGVAIPPRRPCRPKSTHARGGREGPGHAVDARLGIEQTHLKYKRPDDDGHHRKVAPATGGVLPMVNVQANAREGGPPLVRTLVAAEPYFDASWKKLLAAKARSELWRYYPAAGLLGCIENESRLERPPSQQRLLRLRQKTLVEFVRVQQA